MVEENKPEKPETPVLQILNQIKNGEIDPEDIDSDVRLECVDHLWMTEAQTVAVIAQILKVSEKTIKRDQEKIRKRLAEKLTPEDALKALGELLQKGTSNYENLMRMSRTPGGQVQAKALAGLYAAQSIEKQIAAYQSLGLAPTKAMQIEADIHHHQEEEISVEELKKELASLEKRVQEKGNNDPEILKLIETAKEQIARAEAKQTVDEIKSRIGKQPGTSSEQSK